MRSRVAALNQVADASHARPYQTADLPAFTGWRLAHMHARRDSVLGIKIKEIMEGSHLAKRHVCGYTSKINLSRKDVCGCMTVPPMRGCTGVGGSHVDMGKKPTEAWQ